MPTGARFGAVAFVHRFGSYLTSHVHFYVIVTGGVFSAEEWSTPEIIVCLLPSGELCVFEFLSRARWGARQKDSRDRREIL